MPHKATTRPRGTSRRGLARRWQFRGLALLLALATGGAMFEVVVRTTRLGSAGYRSTAVPAEAEKPGSLGPDFRGRSPDLEKPPGTFRILVVGDSYAWGDGVARDDVFAVRLERLIAPIWRSAGGVGD